MYSVLLVDDEILVRDAIRENINWGSLGFELVGDCQNGKEAIAFVKNHPVDLVLTDICMPFVDGMELSKFLYENFPQTAIIIFSGFSEFEYAQKAIQYKVSEYILKPVTAVELSEVLRKIHEKLDNERKEELEKNRLKATSRTYRKNESVILSNALSQLVMSTMPVEKSLTELNNLGITIQASDYRVAVIELDIYSDLYEIDDEMKKDRALMGFVVDNISNEIIRSYGAGMAYQDSDNRVFLLLETNKPKEFLRISKNMCLEIQDKIKENIKMGVSIGLGTYVQNLEDLHYSYESSLRAIQYRYILGEGIVLDMEEMASRINGEVSLEDKNQSLAFAIKNNMPREIESVFSDIFNMFVENLVGKNRACMYMQQMIRAISDVAIDLDAAESADEEKRNLLLNEIADCRSFNQAIELVKQFAYQVAKEMLEMNHSSGQRQSILAMDYIKKHFGDSDLNLNTICSYLCISTSHFSTIFKDATGSTFMEVLINTRMEKAKELLEHTSLKNYEIAERVGFSDPHYFSISFKKMTGKTPTEYAKEKR